MTFGMEKLEWCGYPTVKKMLKIHLFVSTEYTNVTDKRSDRRTDTAPRHRPRLCARQKPSTCSAEGYNFTAQNESYAQALSQHSTITVTSRRERVETANVLRSIEHDVDKAQQ